MAATLGRSGIQPPREDCLDPVITVDILELIIEEKFDRYVRRNQKAPNGHCVKFDVRVVALFYDSTQTNVGAGLLAKTVCQTTHVLTIRPISRASPLP
jgi:hypothetical protein